MNTTEKYHNPNGQHELPDDIQCMSCTSRGESGYSRDQYILLFGTSPDWTSCIMTHTYLSCRNHPRYINTTCTMFSDIIFYFLMILI